MNKLTPLQTDLLACVGELPEADQHKVLDLARSLSASENQKRRRGTPGKELLKFAGSISKEDADQMRKAIEEDCERIDHASW